jgi:hypothetical protein
MICIWKTVNGALGMRTEERAVLNSVQEPRITILLPHVSRLVHRLRKSRANCRRSTTWIGLEPSTHPWRIFAASANLTAELAGQEEQQGHAEETHWLPTGLDNI